MRWFAADPRPLRVPGRRRRPGLLSIPRCSSRCPSASTPRSSFSPRASSDLWWVVPLLATAGSVAGAALTFWMGVQDRRAGARSLRPAEAAEQRPAPRPQQRRDRARRARLIPPPFPFTPFVLAAGALKVNAATFLRHPDRLPAGALRPRGCARRRLRPPHHRLARLRSLSRHRPVLHRRRRDADGDLDRPPRAIDGPGRTDREAPPA